MAKYDAARVAETAAPFVDGTGGIEPLCDEFGRLILEPTTETAITALLARMAPATVGPTSLAPKTVPTSSAEAVAASTTATRYVCVASDFANTKTVYVGGSNVTAANGHPLGPGDVYTREVNNANLIYCISADAAQVLHVEVL